MRDLAELGVVRHPVGVKYMSRLWTEEEDSLLTQICASGEPVSAPEIARRISEVFSISPPLTRAAVVGRARRKKIKLPLDRCTKKVQVAQATPQHNFASQPVRRTHEPDKRQLERLTLIPDVPRSTGVYLLNSSDNDCKRPIGSGTGMYMRVCGEPIVAKPFGNGGGGYCDACLKIVLEPGAYRMARGNFVLPTKKKG